MKVSAVVVTYNRLHLLRTCVKSLLKQNYDLDKIVIINNNSTDGTSKYLNILSNKSNKFIVKNLDKNVGGAGGFNIGINLAYELTNSDLFWIMDDDSMPTKDALKHLIISGKKLHEKFGFLCSNVRSYENFSPCNIPKVDKNNWNIFLPGNLIKIKIATFVSFMVSRHIVYKLGLPIAPMFIWGDDVEYSLRLSNYSPCYFVSNSVVIHNSKGTSSKFSLFNLPKVKDIYLKYHFRNELYAVRKHCHIKYIILKLLSDFYFLVRIPFLSNNNKIRTMYYSILGVLEGFCFNPHIQFPKTHKKI